MTHNRVCQKCNFNVEYELSANFMVFCPHCHDYIFLECEFGYGPVVPCFILLGTEKIAKIVTCTYDQNQYVLQSDHFGINIMLKHKYLDALVEGKAIVSSLLRK